MARSDSEVETRRQVGLPNGATATHLPSLLKPLVPAGTTFTFPLTQNVIVNGQVVTYEAGPCYELDAATQALLTSYGVAFNAF